MTIFGGGALFRPAVISFTFYFLLGATCVPPSTQAPVSVSHEHKEAQQEMSRNERQPFQLSPARTQTQALKLNTTTPALSSSDPVNGWGPGLAWPVTCPQS